MYQIRRLQHYSEEDQARQGTNIHYKYKNVTTTSLTDHERRSVAS
jgi:hypothetical protein